MSFSMFSEIKVAQNMQKLFIHVTSLKLSEFED